jgi:hypothetical protein
MVGARPEVEVTVRDVDGELADPTAITFRVMDPGGNIETYDQDSSEVSNASVGLWSWQPASGLSIPGTWWVYVVSTGGGADVATETSFFIEDIHVPLAP